MQVKLAGIQFEIKADPGRGAGLYRFGIDS